MKDLTKIMIILQDTEVKELELTAEAVRESIVKMLEEAGSFGILVAEKSEHLSQATSAKLSGIIGRNVSGPELIECVRRVARGQQCVQRGNVTTLPIQDTVGARVRDRLTPREMQIVALIVQGCKNKDIAAQLGTKEQVVKNYLRSIYDKTGVSDRLELALFTLHHKLLAHGSLCTWQNQKRCSPRVVGPRKQIVSRSEVM